MESLVPFVYLQRPFHCRRWAARGAGATNKMVGNIDQDDRTDTNNPARTHIHIEGQFRTTCEPDMLLLDCRRKHIPEIIIISFKKSTRAPREYENYSLTHTVTLL